MSDEKQSEPSLEEVLYEVLRSFERDQKETIGEVLFCLHEVERVMATLISVMFFPLFPGRFSSMCDDFILPASPRAKIDFLKKAKLINKTEAGQLQSIFDKRNLLAHPRPETSPLAFDKKERIEVLKVLKDIEISLHKRMVAELATVKMAFVSKEE